MTERLVAAEEIAEQLSVPASWVYTEARAGRLPHVRLGRYVRFSPSSVQAWAAGKEQGPTPYRRYAETVAKASQSLAEASGGKHIGNGSVPTTQSGGLPR